MLEMVPELLGLGVGHQKLKLQAFLWFLVTA
jgi:hypothetical protein